MSAVADVLNGAADLIERDGWAQGYVASIGPARCAGIAIDRTAQSLRLPCAYAVQQEGTVARLLPLGVPWVVENVEGASMPTSAYWFRLCGSSFDLDVRRHRRFASNVAVLAPLCEHHRQAPRFRSLDSQRPAHWRPSWESTGI